MAAKTKPGLFGRWLDILSLIVILSICYMILATVLVIGLGFIADVVLNLISHGQDSMTP